MIDVKKESLARLQAISAALGVSVDQFMVDTVPIDLMAAEECLRIWGRLKTDKGREKALDALRRVAIEEVK